MASLRTRLSILRVRRRIGAALALGMAVAIVTPAARSAEFTPKPDTYLCPDSTGGAVDCYLQAVKHLYTMCRHVKSIEIIEFGYEKSSEGTNGAKSEYCVDKHRLSMTRPYQSALREATPSRVAIDGLRALQDFWLKSLAELKWFPGETDEQYHARVNRPYEIFSERATAVRAAMPVEKGKAGTPAAPARPKSAN